jgi:hypothetical protein
MLVAVMPKPRGIQKQEWTTIFDATVGKNRVRRHILAPITKEHRTEMGFRYPNEDIGRALVVDENLSYDPKISGKAWDIVGFITEMSDPVVVRALQRQPQIVSWRIFQGARAGCGGPTTKHGECKMLGEVEFPEYMTQFDVLKRLVEVEGYPADIFANWNGIRKA